MTGVGFGQCGRRGLFRHPMAGVYVGGLGPGRRRERQKWQTDHEAEDHAAPPSRTANT